MGLHHLFMFNHDICVIFLLQQILNYSQVSESGKQFVKRLSDVMVQSTLFVPDNNGLPANQVSPTQRPYSRYYTSTCLCVLTCPCVPADSVSAGH